VVEWPGSGLRFLGVVGASGSGKSSLVRAGLVPGLRWRPESAGWPVAVLTPTARPFEALAAALVSDGQNSPASLKLAETLSQGPEALLETLSRGAGAQGRGGEESPSSLDSSPLHPRSPAPRSFSPFPGREGGRGVRSSPPPFLLIVDQFEELFTLCRSEA